MEIELLVNYVFWILAYIISSQLLKYFAKRFSSKIKLFFICFLITWIFIAIFFGYRNIYFGNNYALFNLKGFAGLLAESLPVSFFFGGIPLIVKLFKSTT